MIYAPLSNFVRSIDEPVSVSATITADGQALVGATQANGLYGVGPSTGAAGERFVGFVRTQRSETFGWTTRTVEFALNV